MADLTAFLRARLDEDEAVAKAASPGPWHLNIEGDEVLAVDDVTAAEAFALSGNQQRATASHIAQHDPARVLREVAAKRAILEQLSSDLAYSPPVPAGHQRAWAIATLIVEALAGAWSDHPDYDPAWAPNGNGVRHD